jgi:hypothetical protein
MTRCLIPTLFPLIAACAPALARAEKLSKMAPPPLYVFVESETGTTRVPILHGVALPRVQKGWRVLNGVPPVSLRANGRAYAIRAGLGFPL